MNFDPFSIRPDHEKHARDVHLIKLEASGRVFCPLCLKNQTISNFDSLNDESFQIYVRSLFEALDQRSENLHVRSIVLPILEVIAIQRSIKVKDEHDLHNLLRILNRIISSTELEPNEFTLVARIFSRISSSHISSIPLLAIWRVLDKMLNYARTLINNYSTINFQLAVADTCRFFSCLASIIKTYLELIGYFSIGQVPDIIFPLTSKDEPTLHSRKYYVRSQETCLEFMSNEVLDRCWTHICKINKKSSLEEQNMVIEVFAAIDQCFESSTRLNHKFREFLVTKDCILVTHSLIYGNTSKEFRFYIRKFIKNFVAYHMDKEFESDDEFTQYMRHEEVVETNHKNAIVHANLPTFRKTIFYILINCLALKFRSKYFHLERVKSVTKTLKPQQLFLSNSRTLMRAFNYLVANLSLTIKLGCADNIKNFLRQTWRDMYLRKLFNEFNQQFCFEDTVLYWAFDDDDFIKLVNRVTIAFILKRSVKCRTLVTTLKNLIRQDEYSKKVVKFLYSDESSLLIIQELVKYEKGSFLNMEDERNYNHLISRLSSILPPLLNHSILELLEDEYDISKERILHRLLSMTLLMLSHCKAFIMALDDRYIADLFKFAEVTYAKNLEEQKDTLILLNELISLLIITNNESLMKVLDNLNFTVLGHAYHVLKISDAEIPLVKSIVHLLVCYRSIDYPLNYNILDNLYPSTKNIISWMLSSNNELHSISIELTQKVFSKETNRSLRACITTSLIHMLIANPKFIQKREYIKHIKSLMNEDEFRYNPLKNRLQELIHHEELDRSHPPPSPAISFTSADSNVFEEDQIEVNQILSQLEGGMLFDDDCKISNNLFVSQAIRDQLSRNPDIDSWERMAHETIETSSIPLITLE